MDPNYKWAMKSAGIGYLWSLVFWIEASRLSWELFRIPVGLASVAYPFLFTLPVLVLLAGYEMLIAYFVDKYRFIRDHRYVWTLGLPMLLIPLSLLTFFTTETGHSLVAELWHALVH